MRILTINLLAVAALLFSATVASAYDFRIQLRDGTTSASSLTASDSVLVDIYLDNADPGLVLFGMPVLFPNDGTITYDAVNLPAAPISPDAPAGYATGAGPTYILYTLGAMAVPTTQLNPQLGDGTGGTVAGAWLIFNGTKPAGQEQVNIGYVSPGFEPVSAGAASVYIATILFHIENGFSGASIELCSSCGGFVVNQNGVEIDASNVGLSGPVTLTGVVPEPTTAMLVGLGVLGLAVAGRRRA